MGGPNHDIRSNAGRTIFMPEYYSGENGFGNLAIPNVYAADDTTTLYPRGTKLVQGNRVFKYGTYRGKMYSKGVAVTETDGSLMRGRFVYSYAYIQDMANGLLVRKQANEISMAYQTTVSDAQSDNYYAGGWVAGLDTTPSTERIFFRRIISQDYQSTGSKTEKFFNASTERETVVDLSAYSDVSILEVDQPFEFNKTSMATGIMQNPYKLIFWAYNDANAHYYECMGAGMHNTPVVGSSGWFQTYGEMYCIFYNSEAGGAAEGERMVMLMADGSVQIRTANHDYDGSSYRYQTIGYVMGNTAYNAGTPGTPEDETLPMFFMTLSR